MMRTTRRGLFALAAAALFLIGAGANKVPERTSADSPAADQTTQGVTQPGVRPQPTLDVSKLAEPQVPQPTLNPAPNYNLDWWSINGGGAISASSANYQMGLSVGQGAAGEASSANYSMGIGFWYGAGGSGGGACPIVMTGDVNLNGSITSADIIYLVGYVFKGGPGPLPCEAAGDVNCNGSVTSADIIYLVGYVFKGGPAPCDVCTLIPGTWSCP